MDEEVTVGLRLETAAFRREVAAMRAELEGPLADGAVRAGRTMEAALLRAVRSGSFGFEDLKRTALSAMAQIASAALRSGVGAIGGGAGIGAIAAPLLGAFLGLPGRSTGGGVAPGRGYLVGERGPELFVPTASGRVEPLRAAGGRDVRVNVTINAPAGTEGPALTQSSRQVARAVRAALMRAE